MLKKSTYDEKRPFRINEKLSPGALTESMTVPWQADFRDCEVEKDTEGASVDWWPGQRPNQVFRNQQRVEWVPRKWDKLKMVDRWLKLGFVVGKEIAGKVKYVEDERFLTPDDET